MAASRTIIIAGAGIGGLTAALALAGHGYRVVVIEQAERLEEAGAGIQLSPNATRVLFDLGLAERLRAVAVEPDAVEIATGDGRPLARVDLGAPAAARYGTPYWAIHRADLQSALAAAAGEHPDIELRLGTRFEDYALHPQGISVACWQGSTPLDERGIALIGADGLWSALRGRLGHHRLPQFRRRTAWRALLPAELVAPALAAPTVRLWLGADAHLVHYPVRGGRLINIVAIVGDRWSQPGWSTQASRDEFFASFPLPRWAATARALLEEPKHWYKWALYDLPTPRRWGQGPVTLLGDAAHPMLPFLAQGAAMAIEDAAILALSLAHRPDDMAGAMRHYEAVRRPRVRRVQRAAHRNDAIYHYEGARAALRDLTMRALGGDRLLRRLDWLYSWLPFSPPR